MNNVAPTMVWAMFTYDPKIKEQRLVAIYMNGEHANLDAIALSNAESQPTVELFEIHNSPQYTSVEPAVEASAEDFDTPIHVPGEIQ